MQTMPTKPVLPQTTDCG